MKNYGNQSLAKPDIITAERQSKKQKMTKTLITKLGKDWHTINVKQTFTYLSIYSCIA